MRVECYHTRLSGRIAIAPLLSENLADRMNDERHRSASKYQATDLESSDAELIRGCRDGRQDAWDKLVSRYQRLIYAIPRRAGLNDEQAADVFQDVFLTLFEKLDEIEQPEKIRWWIVTTASSRHGR